MTSSHFLALLAIAIACSPVVIALAAIFGFWFAYHRKEVK